MMGGIVGGISDSHDLDARSWWDRKLIPIFPYACTIAFERFDISIEAKSWGTVRYGSQAEAHQLSKLGQNHTSRRWTYIFINDDMSPAARYKTRFWFMLENEKIEFFLRWS
jgi:hypothetical protein